MKAIHLFKVAGLLRAPALSAALIFIPSAFAERPMSLILILIERSQPILKAEWRQHLC